MLVIHISRHCLDKFPARQWEVKGKRAKLRKESEVFFYIWWRKRWVFRFWRVILSLSVMAPRGDTRSQISVLWRGCRLSSVNGSRRVLSLWLFYMQASVSWIRYRFKSIDSAPVSEKKNDTQPYCTFTMSSLLWPTNIRLEIDRYIGLPIFFPIFKHFTIIGYRFWKKKISVLNFFFFFFFFVVTYIIIQSRL